MKKFIIAKHDKNDRNIKATLEQVKQQTYVNNIENKEKINEVIDNLNGTTSDLSILTTTVDTLSGTVSTATGDITSLQGRMTTAEGKISTLEGVNDYSTSEQVVGKWINNKPLYRKVLEIASLPNATSASYNHNISNAEIIKLSGMAYRSGDGTYFPLPFINPASLSYGISLTASSGVVSIQAGIDRSNLSGHIEILYTKTTD